MQVKRGGGEWSGRTGVRERKKAQKEGENAWERERELRWGTRLKRTEQSERELFYIMMVDIQGGN